MMLGLLVLRTAAQCKTLCMMLCGTRSCSGHIQGSVSGTATAERQPTESKNQCCTCLNVTQQCGRLHFSCNTHALKNTLWTHTAQAAHRLLRGHAAVSVGVWWGGAVRSSQLPQHPRQHLPSGTPAASRQQADNSRLGFNQGSMLCGALGFGCMSKPRTGFDVGLLCATLTQTAGQSWQP